MGMLVQAER